MTANPIPLRPHHPVLRPVKIPAHRLRIGDVVVDQWGQPTSAVTSVRLEGAPPTVSAGFAFTTRRTAFPAGDTITVLRLPEATTHTGSAA